MPSSPEVKSPPPDGQQQEYGEPHELTFLPLDCLTVPAATSTSNTTPCQRTPFEGAMANATLPESGPEHFAARCELWRTFRGSEPVQSHPPPKRSRKLQAMLSQEGPIEDEAFWKAGLDKIWKGLLSGQRVKDRLPLRDAVRILLLFISRTLCPLPAFR